MSMNLDDNTIVLEHMKKDPSEILGLAFQEYRSVFLRLVDFRMDPVLAERIDPEDVLQEAWVAATGRVSHFVGQNAEMSLFVWLRLIVIQTLVDQQRHHLGAKMRDAYRQQSLNRSRDPSSDNLTSISLVHRLIGSWTSPSGAAIRQERATQLREAIESMDPIDREVLALRHFEELTNTQTAEVLGIQQKAASIRYVRSLRRLKGLLESLPGFGGEI